MRRTGINCSDLSHLEAGPAATLPESTDLAVIAAWSDAGQGGAVTEEGYPPRQPHRPGRSGPSRPEQPIGHPIRRPLGRSRSHEPREPREPRRTGWQVIDAFDERSDSEADRPPWAGPVGVAPLRPASRPPRVPPPELRMREYSRAAESDLEELDHEPSAYPDPPEPGSRRPGRSRAAAARRRRSKRRLLTWGSAAIIVVIIVGGVLLLIRAPAHKSQFVTTLQKGELRAVPDACKAIGGAALRQLMSGTPRQIQPQQSQAQSECTFTVDARPTFQVLNVDVQAFQANLVAVGNGSATADARYTFAQKRSLLAKPPKRTPEPPATITSVPGLGNQAFSAVQTFGAKAAKPAKETTYLVTVLVRYRNVLITVSFEAQKGHGFGPVSVVGLRSGALNVARAALARVQAEPTV